MKDNKNRKSQGANLGDREYLKLCEFAMHIFDKLLAWYAAFIAVNIIVVGWLLSQEVPPRFLGAALVSAWIVLQNVLGIYAVRSVYAHLRDVRHRISELLDLNEENPIPLRLYKMACDCMAISLATTAGLFSVLPFLLG